MADGFLGPDDLADAILGVRREFGITSNKWSSLHGTISENGVRGLFRIVYHASQARNEGRYPQLTLFVPTEGEEVHLAVSLREELNVALLSRISGRGITDAGLQHLSELKKLSSLFLTDTSVTNSGVALMRMALPTCQIFMQTDQKTPFSK